MCFVRLAIALKELLLIFWWWWFIGPDTFVDEPLLLFLEDEPLLLFPEDEPLLLFLKTSRCCCFFFTVNNNSMRAVKLSEVFATIGRHKMLQNTTKINWLALRIPS